jgi:hypothetical protein
LFFLDTPVSSTNNTDCHNITEILLKVVLNGIPNSRLILALEPEAASIYCKDIPVDRTLSSGGKSTLDAFAAGTQYLILYAGGKNVTI